MPVTIKWAFLVAQLVNKSACNSGDLDSIPGLGRSPGEGKGYPLQYSGLENCMDCIVHGVAKSRTQLSNLNFHFHSNKINPNFFKTTGNVIHKSDPCSSLHINPLTIPF